MRQRKDETREQFNARANEYMKQRYADAMDWLRKYKVEKGCADCGWNVHHAGLEIDHLIPRNGDQNKRITRMAVGGIAVLKRELQTCEVVWGTCHNMRTWNRLHGSQVLK